MFLGTVGAELFILYVYHFFAYSRTVFAVYAVLLLIAVTLSRASFRLLGEFVQRQRQSGVRVVIYGAGDNGGTGAPRGVRRRRRREDSRFHRRRSAEGRHPRGGYPVLGGSSALMVLAKAGAVDRIVICVRQMPPERLNNLEVLCAENNVSLLRLKVGLESIVDSDAPHSESARARARS